MCSSRILFLAAASAAALCSLSPAMTWAQSSSAAPQPASQAKPPEVQAVLEPRAIELLKATASKLAQAKSLSFSAIVGYEYPRALGPALLYTVRYNVTLQRPDKLRIIVPGDGPASDYYYDGKQVMAYLPSEDLVAIADAPPTVEGALKQAYERSATYFPFSDLIVADPYAALADGLKLAYVIGESTQVGGVRTQMIGLANDTLFLQVWIGADDKLPRRIRAVYREDPLRLRHEMDLSDWVVDGAVPAGTFTSEKAKQGKPMQFGNPALKTSK